MLRGCHTCRLIVRHTSFVKSCIQNRSYASGGVAAEESGYEEEGYPGHIPTSGLQKTLLSVGAAAMAITSPWRGDMIATLGETTGQFALRYMRQKMLSDPVGREILKEKPRINSRTVDLQYLSSLPEETFGKHYATWLDDNRCHPDERLPVHFVDDAQLAYVMQRYREVHDLVHCLLGMPTHMLGEVAIKEVEAFQTWLPMCVTGAMFGQFRLRPKHSALFRSQHVWWAARVGTRSSFLLNVYFEREWQTPVDELRRRLNIEDPPPTPPKRWTDTSQ